MKGRILFSSSSLYLTYPQFKAIIPELNDFKKILINVNAQYTKEIDNNYIKEKNATLIFDSYIKLNPKREISFDSLKNYRIYKNLLTGYLYKINPNAIISGSDLAISDRVMYSWCKKKNVPFIILQPSFLDAFPEKYGLKKIINYIIINKIFGLPVYRKYILYGNESQKSYLFLWSKYFIKNPKRKNRFTLGNPAFDRLFKNFNNERKLKNAILICTENLPAHIYGKHIRVKIIDIFLRAIISKPEITYYIKVHPRESIENYIKLFPKSKFRNVKVVQSKDLYELFSLCDIQISVASFTSFEAAAMGLPIVTVRPDNNIRVFDHFKQEIDIRVTEAEEIVDKINLCLSDDYWNRFIIKREKYFKKMLYSTDAQSSKRVALTIRKLILNK